MQHYFVNCLVALLVVVATLLTRTASGITVFDVLTNDGPIINPETVVEPADIPAVKPPTLMVEPQKKTTRKRVLKKFVDVELDVSQEHITLEEGESFVLTCSVKSNPQAIVQWIRGHNLKEEIRKLTKKSVTSTLLDYTETRLVALETKYVIDCATNEDAGPLHCVAIAGDKVAVQSRTIAVVESNQASRECNSAKPPVITRWVTSIFAYWGTTIWLPCEAEGVPRPKTQWINENGTKIDNDYNPRYTILPNGDLLIEKLGWMDMGGIACVAKSINEYSEFAETFVYPMKHDSEKLDRPQTGRN